MNQTFLKNGRYPCLRKLGGGKVVSGVMLFVRENFSGVTTTHILQKVERELNTIPHTCRFFLPAA